MSRGLVVFLSMMAASAGAQERNPSDGRGWVFGGGLTGGSMSFSAAEGRALAVGRVARVVSFLGGSVEQRTVEIVDGATNLPPDTVLVATFPESTTAAALTLHGGYAFSRRIALLADAELMGPWSDGFTNGIFGAVLRYRPVRRVWVEAGPARGDLGYAYQGTGSVDNSITGTGFLAAAGITALSKPKWAVDLQARYGRIWYEGVQATNLSFGLSVGRVRS